MTGSSSPRERRRVTFGAAIRGASPPVHLPCEIFTVFTGRAMPSSLLMVLLAVFAPLGAHTGRVSLRGKRLFVDGAPFFIQGVAYSPVPLGDDPIRRSVRRLLHRRVRSVLGSGHALACQHGRQCRADYSWNRTRDHTAFLDMAHKHGVMVVATYFLGSTSKRPYTRRRTSPTGRGVC